MLPRDRDHEHAPEGSPRRRSKPASGGHRASDPYALDEAVDRIAARHGKHHVGLVVGAVTSTGARSVVPIGRVRASDGPAPRADTLFEIGSVTKVFTGLLLAEAVTRGELSLDTPVGALLPEVPVRTATARRSPSSTWQPTPRGYPTTRCRSWPLCAGN